MELHEAYEDRVELHLRLWEGELARLRAANAHAPADRRISYSLVILGLYEQFTAVRHCLAALEQARGLAWTIIQEEVERAVADLTRTLDRAVAQLPFEPVRAGAARFPIGGGREQLWR